MPRSRPNRRDYVTVQLQRMMGKKNKAPNLIPDEPVPNQQNTSGESDKGETTSETKQFRTPSIPSASIAKQPDLWRKRDNDAGIVSENDLTNSSTVKPPLPPKNPNLNETQDITLPSIQIQLTENQSQYPQKEQVQYNSSRPKWNRQFSYKSAAQDEFQQAIDNMPPLQVFSDVLRLDRIKKSIDEDSFADIEMWKEILQKREKFDISEPDIFHFFSQKAQMPASVLVGGHGSGATNPFQVIIDGKSWLLWSIMSQDLNMISYLCKRRPKDVADFILTDETLSYNLMSLLLSKDCSSITQTRIDFLTVVALKFHKHPNDGKNYLKKYSIETNKISLDDTGDFSNHSTQCTNPLLSRALKEVQSCYPLQPIEKVSLISGLIFNVLFMSGWIIYMWALATDIELLIRNYGCNEPTISLDNNANPVRVSVCSGGVSCLETSKTFPGYFYYTLSASIIPFLVNLLLVINQILVNDKTYTMIEIGFSRRNCLPKMSPTVYKMIYFFWILGLFLFYPIAVKILYIVSVYHHVKTKRKMTITRNSSTKDRASEIIEEYETRCKHASNELILSETVLATTALTFQSIIQLFSLQNNLKSCYLHGGYDLLEVISYPQLRSIVSCALGFSVILTTHSMFVKHSSNLIPKLPITKIVTRIILFLTHLCPMIGRMMLLVFSSAIIFKSYDHLELLLVLHVIVFSLIHIIDYYCIKKLSPNLASISLWIEVLINGCGCIFLPVDISFGETVWKNKRDGSAANRFYTSSTTRFIIMYSIIIAESAILSTFAYQEENSSSFILIWISIGLIIAGLIFHIIYYCVVYPWPLGLSTTSFFNVLSSKENDNLPSYPSLLDENGEEVLSNFKVGGLEIEAVTPKTPRTPRSRSRIAFSIPDEETEM